MAWTRKDLVSMQDIEAGEIGDLLDTAESMKEIATREIKKVPTLRGKTVVNLFYESSTRTRTSFEIAGKWLSADVINFSASGSSAAAELPAGGSAGWGPGRYVGFGGMPSGYAVVDTS